MKGRRAKGTGPGGRDGARESPVRAGVRRFPRRASVAALAIVVAAAAAGYLWWRAESPTAETPAASPAAAAGEMEPLPDLSGLDPAVQQQLRDQHAAVARLLDSDDSTPMQTAEALGALGRLMLAAEFFREAERAFERAKALAPTDMRWPYYLAHVYRIRQEPSRAIETFEQVLVLAPDDVPTLLWLGDLRLATGAADAAERAYQRAFALRPQSVAAVSRLGRAALARGDYGRAVGYLERALSMDPQASVRYPLGMAYRGLGDAAKAAAHLKQASDSGVVPPPDPLMDAVAGLLRGAGAFETRGMEALDARDWKRAVQNLQQAVNLNPQNAVTRLNLGTALSLAGDADAARRELTEALRLDPTLAKAHFTLGVLAQDEGRWGDAIQRFTAAVASEPGFVDAHFTLAEALRRTGRAADALPHYAAVLRLNPAASQASFGRAIAFVQLRRYADARAALEEAVRIYPGQPGFTHALARLLAAAPDAPMRDGRRALMLLEPLAAAQPSASVSETMAMVMAELGRFSEAVDWQQRAIAAANAAGDSNAASRMQDNLALYKANRPCRTPWRDDDPVIAAVSGT